MNGLLFPEIRQPTGGSSQSGTNFTSIPSPQLFKNSPGAIKNACAGRLKHFGMDLLVW
jgi:hypothetical protein